MKKFFVLGSGIGYSLSPKLHSEMFGLFKENAEYTIMDIKEDGLKDIAKLVSGAVGFNVTKPFKTEIIKYLQRDKSECGSVNTVTVSDMTGYSTDGDGFLFDLEYQFKGASTLPTLIIGYGGAARACVTALKKRGADIYVTGRDEQKAAAFCNEFGVKQLTPAFKPHLIVSCVTNTFMPTVDTSKVEACYDLRYTGETLKIGSKSSNGLGMLIAQAIYSYSIFMGKQFDNSELTSVYLYLKERV